MNEEMKTNQGEETQQQTCCPFCFIQKSASELRAKHSGFFMHLLNARVEFLQAFRSLIDQQITSLEHRRDTLGETRKATKIKVE